MTHVVTGVRVGWLRRHLMTGMRSRLLRDRRRRPAGHGRDDEQAGQAQGYSPETLTKRGSMSTGTSLRRSSTRCTSGRTTPSVPMSCVAAA